MQKLLKAILTLIKKARISISRSDPSTQKAIAKIKEIATTTLEDISKDNEVKEEKEQVTNMKDVTEGHEEFVKDKGENPDAKEDFDSLMIRGGTPLKDQSWKA